MTTTWNQGGVRRGGSWRTPSSAAPATFPESARSDRVLFHQAAGHVDHAHPVLHGGEGVRVEPVLGLRGHGKVHRHKVGAPVELLGGLGALHAQLAEALLGHVGVEGHHAHPEAQRALCHELADAPETEHAERLVVQLDAAELRPLPGAARERSVGLRHLAREREQERACVRAVITWDWGAFATITPRLVAAVHVHVVHPHPCAAHGLQALGAPEQICESGWRAIRIPSNSPMRRSSSSWSQSIPISTSEPASRSSRTPESPISPYEDLHAFTRSRVDRDARVGETRCAPPRPRRLDLVAELRSAISSAETVR